ncbi:unnamed protein product [marine sediment metagenome]|uniref:Uncharacterized protein n=1 Tax=marine sediment metagenome TaxID=412755 RepID=X1BX97_9ZZZZ
MVHVNDMNELRRMVTNFYDMDKACVARVLRGITDLKREVTKLKLENESLKIEKDKDK